MSYRIGIIETGKSPASLEPTYGTYAEMGATLLTEHLGAFVWTPISVIQGEPLPDIEAFDGYLIMGSEFSANDTFPWVSALYDFVVALAKARTPLVGICFGHQLIAKALGGTVVKMDWVVGRQDYQALGGQNFMPTLSYHQDQVTALPTTARQSMTSAACTNAAMTYRDWPCWTIQSHPEFSKAYMRELIEHTRGRPLTDTEADDALASLDVYHSDTAFVAENLRYVFDVAGSNVSDAD